MRLQTDKKSAQDIRDKMSQWNENLPDSEDELCEQFKMLQRTRTLALWHDHATLLGLEIVMITVHIVFDPAVFYTQSEWNDRSLNLQSTIESSSIYMLCIRQHSCKTDSIALTLSRTAFLHLMKFRSSTSFASLSVIIRQSNSREAHSKGGSINLEDVLCMNQRWTI